MFRQVQLSTATSTWASGIIWDEEALLCRSLVQQSLSTLMQDLRSLEKMRSSITDEDIQRLEDLAIPCCRRICSAIEEAKAGIIFISILFIYIRFMRAYIY